ncbi:MAG TPA: peptide ABC transporter substrate-binding protein [Clostridiaceae bacterium]|nr:peptide ABC transporter substrate-binding protein [Clostridiaceae bacterium]
MKKTFYYIPDKINHKIIHTEYQKNLEVDIRMKNISMLKIAVSIILLLIIAINCTLAAGCNFSLDIIEQSDNSNNINSPGENIIDRGPVNGGTLNMFSTVPDTLNPLLTNNIHVHNFSALIFESLVKLDSAQNPVPYLAENWEVSDNALEWIFHLRKNVLWHNGDSFTASDVKYSFDIIKSSFSNSVYNINVRNVKNCEILDENTIKFTLFVPDSFTAEKMNFPVISEKHYGGLGEIKSAGMITPVGTGPYKFESMEKDELIILKANPDWWNRKETGSFAATPYISFVNIKLYETKEDIYNAFESKNVDFIPVQKDQSYKYHGRTDINIYKFPGRNFEFIAFNLSNPVLSDINVRKAISYAIDRFDIMKNVLPDKVLLSDIPVIPGTWLNEGISIDYRYPDKAVEVLENSGWRLSSNRWSKYMNGRTYYLDFELVVNEDNSDRLIVAKKIQEQLKDIGINISIKELSWDEKMKNINNKKFDMAFMGVYISRCPDMSFLYSSQKRYAREEEAYNVTGYENIDVDNYLNKILTELDPMKKKAYFINMKQIISEELPYIGLYFYYDTIIYHKNIRGVSNPHVWDPLMNIPEWYIPGY